MKEKIKNIEKTAIANASTSRLKRRAILQRLQKEQPFKQVEKTNDRLFEIKKSNEVKGLSTGDRYLIKESLSSGTLKLGAKVVGVVDGHHAVIYQPPQGRQIPPTENNQVLAEEPNQLSLKIEIGFV